MANVMLTWEKRVGSAAGRTPSMVTSRCSSGTPVCRACISISVTPHEETPARNASLLVSASACGRDEESRTSCWPRATLTARPTVPLLDDVMVSILSSLTAGLLGAPLGGFAPPRAALGLLYPGAPAAVARR